MAAGSSSGGGISTFLTGGKPIEVSFTHEVATDTLIKLTVFLAVVFILKRLFLGGGNSSPT